MLKYPQNVKNDYFQGIKLKWICEESWAPKNWCFWDVVLEKTLESPLDCKKIKPVNPKGNQPWIFNAGLILKLKLQYVGHLMQRTDSLEKTLILGKIEGKRRRGWQRMSWLDDITSSTHLSLSQLWEVVKDKGAWCAAFQACKELDMSERLNSNNCKEVSSLLHLCVYSISYSYQHRVLFIIFYEVSIILLFLFLKLVQF